MSGRSPISGVYECNACDSRWLRSQQIDALTAERDQLIAAGHEANKVWIASEHKLLAAEAQVERLTAELSRAHAMLDSDMPRWDADRLVIEQGWNTPDRCGRCGEVNPQVERYREVVTFALGVLRSSTMTWEQRGAVTYDALARLDADPPREPEA